MKILHINSYYGASNFYKNLYDKQIERGLDINVFIPVSSSFKIIKAFNYGSYSMISSDYLPIDRFFFHIKHYKVYHNILKKINIKKVDIIHAHSLFSNGFIAYKLKKKYDIPYIVAVRNTDINLFFKKMINLRKLGVTILKNADKIIFLSEAYRETLINKYIPEILSDEIFNKSIIIPNGIDFYWVENKGKVKNLVNRNEIKLLYIGAITENKNIECTIRAIKLLLKEGIRATLTDVGKINSNKIYNKIKDLDFVNYIPPVGKEKLRDIYLNHDIFVMPSKTETFGLVYVEAMSQGLPIIYSKNQGFDKQFEEGFVGYHVKYNDEKEVLMTINRIIENYSTISYNCINSIDSFRWDKICDKYDEIYKNIDASLHSAGNVLK